MSELNWYTAQYTAEFQKLQQKRSEKANDLMRLRLEKAQIAVSSEQGVTPSAIEDVDELFADAGQIIISKNKASIGMLQRALKVGFNRAARIMEQLSEAGVVGPDEGTKPRRVLMTIEQFEDYLSNR